MNNCLEIKTYPIHSHEKDTVLIFIASSEKRCLGLINKLDKSYSVPNAIIIEYDHPCPKRSENIVIMENKLKPYSDVRRIKMDETAVTPKIAEVVTTIADACKNIAVPKITIDISTMIKWHLLLLLKALAQKKLLSFVRFVYTEPEDYFLDLMQPLSFGNKGTFPVPFFQGNFNFSLETCLLLMLGYEGQRALAILESMDPEECLLLIPNPPYKPEWEGRTEKMNKEVINLVGQNKLRYIDARNPYLIKEQIGKIVLQLDVSRYNFVFAPLGPKPQLLGLFDYCMENSTNTNIVYVSPLRHNDIYSKEIGRTWIIKDRNG